MARWSRIAGGTGMRQVHFGSRSTAAMAPSPKLLDLSSLPELPQPTKEAVEASRTKMAALVLFVRLKVRALATLDAN